MPPALVMPLLTPVIEGVPTELLGIGAGWAIVALVVLLIVRGKLVPKSTVDAMEKSYVRQIEDIGHDRDEWRAAHRISETARVEGNNQVGELLEHARTTDSFIRSLPHPSREAT
jgi:hypothetical protein